MKSGFKNTFLGYFQFYYSIIGGRFLVNLALSVSISFLDGLGLAMFIPLLQAVGEDGAIKEQGVEGNISYFTDIIQRLGFDLTIVTILLFLVFIFGLKGLMRFIQMSYQVNLRYLFIKKVRFSLLNSLMNLKYRGFLKLDAGKIQNTLTSEVTRLFQGMNFYFTAAQSSAMLMTYVFLAFLANYQFAFLVAIGAGLSNLIYRRIYNATKAGSIELSKKGNAFNGFLIQSIHNFKYLKSTNYFSIFSKKLKGVIIETESINKKLGIYNAITTSVREPLIIIIVALVIFIQTQWMGSSLTSIILSLLLFYRALSFLMTVQNNWQGFIQTIGSMDAVSKIITQMEDEKEVYSQTVFDGFSKEIILKDIVFSYTNHNIINNLNINIPKNKTIALVGESGSGKTTIANLIAGLIEPSEGGIFIDNVKLETYNLGSYRSKIGFISQEPVIFRDDIFNNITFWAERTPENEENFWRVIKLASLDEFILSLPEKDKTLLGDNGIMISGGQKQRISIARELYKSVEILILDEATSALDSETERVIQDNIDKLHGSYTMIIIAHRLSTIKEADCIYLLEKGKVAASGDFKTMLETSPKFKHMISLQELN